MKEFACQRADCELVLAKAFARITTHLIEHIIFFVKIVFFVGFIFEKSSASDKFKYFVLSIHQ